jgi:hypothetical protein
MDWLKKNMVLVVSCAIALVAIGASGYYLVVQMGKYEQAGGQLSSVANGVNALLVKNPHPGAGKVDNIAAIKSDLQRLNQFKQELTSTFKSTPLGGQTEQAFKAELADILAYIEREGKRTGVSSPTNFNLSFTAQKIGFRFASNSLGPLSMQLADLREITRILVEARVNSIESYKRVPVSEDDTGPYARNASEDDYITNLKIKTNEFTGAIVHPYEITFRCFSEELGRVMEGIAHSPYSIILKTVGVEPAEVRNIKPTYASALEVFGGALGATPSPYGAGGGPGGRPGEGGRGESRMSSVYGGGAGGRDSRMSSVYGGGAGGRPTARSLGPESMSPTLNPALAVPAQPTGPETILTEEPLKVTLGLEVIRMPETPAAKPATN